MKIPATLRPGDKVGIVNTARKMSEEELAPALASLREWGYVPVLGKHVYAIDNQYAGTDAERRTDLQEMADRDDIAAILCGRGGYGTLRIIDGITWKGMKRHPKWLIGFSDVTTTTMSLFQAGLASIHGPMAISWNGATGDDASRTYLRDILAGKFPAYAFAPKREDLTRTGAATGRLIGGNLSMLSQLIGTETDFDTKGCILFLEDLDEYLYHIDRMMVHLKRSGKLDNLAGLVIGGFTDLKDNDTPFGKSAEEIIFDAVKDYNYPVCFGAPVGHQPENYPMLHGMVASLNVSHSTVELKTGLK